MAEEGNVRESDFYRGVVVERLKETATRVHFMIRDLENLEGELIPLILDIERHGDQFFGRRVEPAEFSWQVWQYSCAPDGQIDLYLVHPDFQI